ncbi:hypothetical protein BGX23_011514 [Mortierella sp. AD031]|nr:hypothetical protein BGX23_011514 [Mortierella sp. AD031]
MIGILVLLIVPSATQIAPAPATRLEYTSISDKTLFIRGGIAALQPVVQLFSLDLTPLITGTGKPTWTSLSTSHSSNISDYSSQFAMSVSYDSTTLFYFNNDGFVTKYDIGIDSWDAPMVLYNYPYSYFKSGQKAVTDPINSTLEYGFAWNSLRSNMLLFGRLDSSIPVLREMTTSGIWTEPSTKGSWPASYGESCMVSAQDGRKMVVFGGRMGTQDLVGDLHILDLTATPYTWMSDMSAARGRAGMACASAGNYFVAWGGSDNTTELPSEILYHNLATNQWVSEDSINDPFFTGTGAPKPTTTSTGSQGSSNKGLSKSTIAALGGGIAAVVAIGSTVVFLILRHRGRHDEPAAIGSEDSYEGQKELYTADGQDYSDLNTVIAPTRHPQWSGSTDQISSSLIRGKDPQDASQIPMNAYAASGAPHKYLLNQYNSPQQIPPIVNTNNSLSDSCRQQQQDGVVWSGSPQDTSESTMRPDDNPAKQLALIEVRHQEKLERIRREQEADLLMLQQQWDQKNTENKS